MGSHSHAHQHGQGHHEHPPAFLGGDSQDHMMPGGHGLRYDDSDITYGDVHGETDEEVSTKRRHTCCYLLVCVRHCPSVQMAPAHNTARTEQTPPP